MFVLNVYVTDPVKSYIQSNLNSSNTDGLFTMANSNSCLSPYDFFSANSRKQIFKDIFNLYHEIVCFVYSLESPHFGESNEYFQHIITV